MRLIIELDNEKSLTLSTAEKMATTSDEPTTAPQTIETIDGGAAPMDQFPTAQKEALTPPEAGGIDGGTAPVFMNP